STVTSKVVSSLVTTAPLFSVTRMVMRSVPLLAGVQKKRPPAPSRENSGGPDRTSKKSCPQPPEVVRLSDAWYSRGKLTCARSGGIGTNATGTEQSLRATRAAQARTQAIVPRLVTARRLYARRTGRGKAGGGVAPPSGQLACRLGGDRPRVTPL